MEGCEPNFMAGSYPRYSAQAFQIQASRYPKSRRRPQWAAKYPQQSLENSWKHHQNQHQDLQHVLKDDFWQKTAVGADLTNAVDIAQTEILTPSCTILHLLIPTLIRCHPESQTSKAAISELCPGNSINTSTSAHQNQEQLANIVKSYLERNSHQHQPTT